MNFIEIMPYIIGLFAVVIIFLLAKSWINVYNKFQYWREKAQQAFSDIEVVMQERMDEIYALAQIVKKYDIHEYKALKDTIEARTGWSKDLPLNERVKKASDVENNFIKLQAVFEKYPELKADTLHHRLLGKNSQIETKLRRARKKFNGVARKYNYRTRKFPRSIVAKVHGYKSLDYLTFKNSEDYMPKKIFED